jgi:hypothetical protein
MPQSFPKASILLTAAAKYLEEELLPTLTDYHRFQTRVTVNILNLIRRELELHEGQAASERQLLAELVGRDGDLETLRIDLAKQIRSGAIALENPALRSFIRKSLSDALAINNPKWPNPGARD